MASAITERDRARAEKARLASEYESQLAELDRIKKRQASWRRDRLIREQMSVSHRTAKKLASVDTQLRRLDGQVSEARRGLVATIDRELAASPARTRQAELMRLRGSSRTPGRSDRKIVLPDDRIDPLADPEELDYQASLIRQSEEQLARQLDKLDKQSDRYVRMAALQKNRQRANEHGQLDDDRPRRTPGRSGDGRFTGGTASDQASGPNAPESGSPPPDDVTPLPTTPGDNLGAGTDDGNFDVVLADVVDSSTVDALRAAELSTDPAVKARAAKRAHEQVKARLEELRARRQEIQKRATKLRKE